MKKVLVCCEESQAVANAFRQYGIESYSCDLKPCSGGHPEYHLQGDCTYFVKQDKWDLIIAHPPCTYLSVAGAVNLLDSFGRVKNAQRYDEMLKAREFFMFFYNLPNQQRVCIENPRAMAICNLPPYSQVIQPFMFGDPYTKQTLLWLKNLPLLFPECYSTSKRVSAGCKSWCAEQHTAAMRSKTFQGIANAMAKQWHNVI